VKRICPSALPPAHLLRGAHSPSLSWADSHGAKGEADASGSKARQG